MTIKQSIINEYLVGGISYRDLSKKCGFGITTICRWVATYQGRSSAAPAGCQATVILPTMNEAEKQAEPSAETKDEAIDITTLRQQLAEERLRVKLLTAMIEIAEEELNIPIRKKYGTRQ